MPTREQLVISALIKAVRDEWPDDMNLDEILSSLSPWAERVTPEEFAAVRDYVGDTQVTAREISHG